jgi:hypothetical protein
MEIPQAVWIVGGLAVIAVVVTYVLFVLRSRRINLTRPESPDQKPEWMRTTPPLETVAATRADDEGITLYDYDPGEKVAASFAEQIEDVLRASLNADPALAAMDVDLGTGPGGGLEIWVNGECYTAIDLLPDGRLREAIRRAIARWEQAQQGK